MRPCLLTWLAIYRKRLYSFCAHGTGPVLDELKEKLRVMLSRESKKMPLAKAIHYALTRWDALLRYVDDGNIEIDNNPIEREIRPVALGRKNNLFAGSDVAANVRR